MMGALFMNRLRRDETAATLTEFGFVGPILIMMIIGIFDVAHTQYTSAIVNGAMQKAGRKTVAHTLSSPCWRCCHLLIRVVSHSRRT